MRTTPAPNIHFKNNAHMRLSYLVISIYLAAV
ncbi:putative membrane protein, partial [Acinetobacter baumannii 754286]